MLTFIVKNLSLAIEIDGDTHIYRYDYDEERQRDLEKLGVHFLRFDDIEVKKNMTNVLRVIENWIENHQPTPDPRGSGEGRTIVEMTDSSLTPRDGNHAMNQISIYLRTSPPPSSSAPPLLAATTPSVCSR